MTEGANTHTFGYDELQRLTSAVHPAGQTAESYQYDQVGNRTGSHLTTSYDTQPFNRVVQIGSTTFSYDNNGNLKTKATGSLTTTYDYDHENRLMSVHLPTTPPKVIHYKYDALGRRIEREDASTGAWQRYTHDGAEVRSEENSDGSWVSYVNGDEIDDHLLQRSKSPGSQVIYEYYLSDHQGSVRTLTDANGNVVSGNSYDTFGNRTGTIASRFGYTGREHDPDTGLMYYRARWYSPETGRFVSEDPIGFDGGINLYAYVGNDPINNLDPSGLVKVNAKDAVWVVRFVGNILIKGKKVTLKQAQNIRRQGKNIMASCQTTAKKVEQGAFKDTASQSDLLRHDPHGGKGYHPHYQTEGQHGHSFYKYLIFFIPGLSEIIDLQGAVNEWKSSSDADSNEVEDSQAQPTC